MIIDYQLIEILPLVPSFSKKSIGCNSNNIYFQLAVVTFFETSLKSKAPKVVISSFDILKTLASKLRNKGR